MEGIWDRVEVVRERAMRVYLWSMVMDGWMLGESWFLSGRTVEV